MGTSKLSTFTKALIVVFWPIIGGILITTAAVLAATGTTATTNALTIICTVLGGAMIAPPVASLYNMAITPTATEEKPVPNLPEKRERLRVDRERPPSRIDPEGWAKLRAIRRTRKYGAVIGLIIGIAAVLIA